MYRLDFGVLLWGPANLAAVGVFNYNLDICLELFLGVVLVGTLFNLEVLEGDLGRLEAILFIFNNKLNFNLINYVFKTLYSASINFLESIFE